MRRIAPYGTWKSPIQAQDLAASAHQISGGRFQGDEIWWLEQRPTERGRYSIRRQTQTGIEDLTPAPWNVRSRVHEYGGASWTVSNSGELLFVEFSDQRIYRLQIGGEATALTPANEGFRFAELTLHGDWLLAVRESVAKTGEEDGSTVKRDIVAVPLNGDAAEDPNKIISVVSGSDFLAYPRVSPDSKKLAWIAWNHPQLPWDGTELRVADLGSDLVIKNWQTLAGSEQESVLQPQWLNSEQLLFSSDRSGWWNLYRVDFKSEAKFSVTRVLEAEREFAGPLWNLGTSWYRVLADSSVLAVGAYGSDQLYRISAKQVLADTPVDLAQLKQLNQPISSRLTIHDLSSDNKKALITGSSSLLPGGLRLLDVSSGELEDVRLDVDQLPDAAYLPQAQAMSFGEGEKQVHAFVYPPNNADFEAPEGEKPPYLAFIHGGPTANVSGGLDLKFAYFTSRGIGVIDINYAGSTGYGRAYRDKLKLAWGIADVEDTVTAVTGLADQGLADKDRLLIRGGSAGGWTVLSALTRTKVFAAGASYYGVADLSDFAETTHDFESKYLESLIGPADQKELYHSRAPLTNVANLSAPVLLLQGSDDRIVPAAQSEVFRDALKAKGIKHAYLLYEGESHGFRKAETIVHSIESELSFYGQILGFEPDSVPKLPLDS